MKYLCKTKNSNCEYGVGVTIEKAFEDYQEQGNGMISEVEWYVLEPIKVKLVIDNSPVVKKTAVKKGVSK